jgi:regulator of sigma E protease
VALAEAASRSGGAPFATRWRTSSGRTVERSLVPIPDLQTLAVPPAGGEPGEIDRGILGFVPLMRIQSVAAGSPNADLFRTGDVVLRVENADGPRMAQLRAALAPRAGGMADVVVLREGKEVAVAARVDRAGRLGVLMGPALDLPITASPIDRVMDEKSGTRPTAAAALALLPRMQIDEIGGTPVTDWASMRAALLAATTNAAARGEAESVPVLARAPTPGRERIEMSLALSPQDVRSLHALGWLSPVPPAIFEPLMTRLTAHGNPTTAVAMGFRQTKTMVTMTYITLDRIARGSVGVEQLRGPVGIVHLGARVVDRGAMYLVFFLAMISVNLAVLNFLPLPIVDGGLFLYLVYEQLAGRAPSLRFQNAATMVGLLLLGTLFLFTFYNDVMRIFTGG